MPRKGVVEPAAPFAFSGGKKLKSDPEATDATGATGRAVPPRLAEGMELIGEYQGSGFKDPPYLARRGDGQVLQLPRLLYLVAAKADGRRDYDEIARAVSDDFGRGVSADNVRVLADSKLRPIGVLAAADGSSPKLQRPNPLLSLNFRAAVVPPGLVNAITTIFRPFFWPLVVAAALVGFVALDGWLFFVHGISQGIRTLLNQPFFFLVLFAVVVVSAALHECGHATGCRYGGARPGVMGVGLYLVWPAFYTDVTDAYRLGKAGRLRTDLGGVYFNALIMLATLGIYQLTHLEVLIFVILLLQFEMLHQFLPFLRLDGYYVIADLTGVPDIFARIKPVLVSLLPGRQHRRPVTPGPARSDGRRVSAGPDRHRRGWESAGPPAQPSHHRAGVHRVWRHPAPGATGLDTNSRPAISPGNELCRYGGGGQLARPRLDPASGAVPPDPPRRSRHGSRELYECLDGARSRGRPHRQQSRQDRGGSGGEPRPQQRRDDRIAKFGRESVAGSVTLRDRHTNADADNQPVSEQPAELRRRDGAAGHRMR
ncbi:MAG: hypothetical protein E6I99_14325 [Chloroflexi bacterium]|nr:MAG: hypothetical protein E6I99_14325 [Chloroflexota bacterium]